MKVIKDLGSKIPANSRSNQGIMYILEKHGAHKRNPNKRTKTPSNN